MRFKYESIVNNALDPGSVEKFCKKFLMENVALVKVEMATKSLTRSIKDKRFNFVSQLSSLGKQIFLFVSYFIPENIFVKYIFASNSKKRYMEGMTRC
jgi:hypothetical protein